MKHHVKWFGWWITHLYGVEQTLKTCASEDYRMSHFDSPPPARSGKEEEEGRGEGGKRRAKASRGNKRREKERVGANVRDGYRQVIVLMICAAMQFCTQGTFHLGAKCVCALKEMLQL